MTDQELIYTMALTMALRQQSKHQRTLLDTLGSATAVYESRHELGRMFEHFSERMAESLDNMENLLPQCEKELTYVRDHRVRILALQDEDVYPARLKQCEDAPLLLYNLGSADFNVPHIISIVGTRRCSEIGRDLCEQLVKGIAEKVPGTMIVSGLAYGIDVAAHRAALMHGLPTVGVLAHGLDEIYPRTHRQTAIDMLKAGGLLTEFTSHTPIDRINFLQRNRIVAGLADAVVIVESPARGGSLNTARLASDYHRDVFTFPGRPSDLSFEGCNLLVRKNSATLITSATDLLTDLGWETRAKQSPVDPQTTLFASLSADEQAVVDALTGVDGGLSLSAITSITGKPVHQLMPLMLAMEMKGIIKVLPGNRYHLKM